MTKYPPLREPIVDARTSLVSRPWALFFQDLLGGLIDLASGVTGTLGLGSLPSQAARTLLGRGASSAGTPEVITLGTGLTMTGTTLAVTPQASAYAEPLTNGIASAPELIFADGDVIMVWVEP